MTPTLKELGEQLRQAREGKGLSIKEAAQITKIGPRILDAFEQGDRDKFPHRVYAKGFVKNYAKLLNMDPAECGRAIDQALETREQAQPEPGVSIPADTGGSLGLSAADPKTKRSSLGTLLLLAGLVVLLGVLVWYLFLSPGDSAQEAAGQQEATVPGATVQETKAKDQQEPGEQAVQQSPSGQAAGQGVGATVVEAGADVSDASPAPKPALPPGAHRLEIRAQDEEGSWIGVYALEPNPETGEDVLLKDYTVAGTGVLTLTLDEVRNYRFGRIEGVAVVYDGEPMDIPGNGTRNIVLPPRQ